jgi:glycosyltransferase involved in cell wall biosynthesis
MDMTAVTPHLTIVASVYNGSRHLRPSLASVLEQTGVSFELVVIDDGSTDDSGRVLDEVARADARVRVFHQGNQGLTRALMRGCGEARGRFIARHDPDDLSLPGRFASQYELLASDPTLSMVSCWSRAIGPDGERLFETVRPADAATATAALRDHGDGPPGHGTVMFRADAYRSAGGYRPAFRVAQDWDLWLRLVERGRIAYVPDFLYVYRVEEQSISARRRDQQLRLLDLARRCTGARARGESEELWLAEAARVSAEPAPPSGRSPLGNSYFIGKCLFDRRDRRALKYLRRCVRLAPWNVRHWAALAGASLLCRAATVDAL